MKIYLLMLLIGALLTAVHFTSAPGNTAAITKLLPPIADLGRRSKRGQRQIASPGQYLLNLFIRHP